MSTLQLNNLRRIKQRHLLCFAEVARTGNLQEAAAILHVTAPAISKTLKELQALLGVDLFERNQTGMKLTPEGQVFAAYARRSIEAVTRGIEAMRSLSDMPSLRLVALPTTAAHFLPQVLSRLEPRYQPRLIEVQSGSARSATQLLLHGEIDLILGRLHATEHVNDLAFEHLYTDTWLLVSRAQHPALERIARERKYHVLADYPWILPPPGSYVREEINRVIARADLPDLPRCIETTLVEFSFNYCLRSDALLYVAERSIGPWLDSGALVRVPMPGSAIPSLIGVTARRDSESAPQIRQFILAAQAAAAEMVNVTRQEFNSP